MEEQKKKSHWEGMQKGFGKSLRWEVSWRHSIVCYTGCDLVAGTCVVKDRRKENVGRKRYVPREGGDLLRKYQAKHQEYFLSSRRECADGKEEERERMNKEAKKRGT